VTAVDGKIMGKSKPEGSTYTADNGYHYTKKDGKFRLTHHIIMEEKLSREILPGERVEFIDRDRTNLHPDNIRIVNKNATSLKTQLARLYARRDEILAQIEDLEEQLEADRPLEDQLTHIASIPEAH
jgi:hypothetical protein